MTDHRSKGRRLLLILIVVTAALAAAGAAVDGLRIPLWIVAGLTGAVAIFMVAVSFYSRTLSSEEREQLVERIQSDTSFDVVDRHREAKRSVKRNRGWKGGTPANAVVAGVASMGASNEFSSLVEVSLDVTDTSGQTRRVVIGESVDHGVAGVIAPGQVVAVRVDEDDPDRVRIDWDAMAG